jgi:hypothetical protein
MAKGGSTTAALPIAGSLDDKMVTAISAAQTEMADFLVHSMLNLGSHCSLNSVVPSHQCPNNVQGPAFLVKMRDTFHIYTPWPLHSSFILSVSQHKFRVFFEFNLLFSEFN